MSIFSRHRIQIDRDLFEKLSKASAAEGYSSPDEMAQHLIRRALQSTEPRANEAEDRRIAEEQLRGLGYLK